MASFTIRLDADQELRDRPMQALQVESKDRSGCCDRWYCAPCRCAFTTLVGYFIAIVAVIVIIALVVAGPGFVASKVASLQSAFVAELQRQTSTLFDASASALTGRRSLFVQSLALDTPLPSSATLVGWIQPLRSSFTLNASVLPAGAWSPSNADLVLYARRLVSAPSGLVQLAVLNHGWAGTYSGSTWPSSAIDALLAGDLLCLVLIAKNGNVTVTSVCVS